MVEGMGMGPIGGRGAIASVLLIFLKFCFQIITGNMLESNSSQKDSKVKIWHFWSVGLLKYKKRYLVSSFGCNTCPLGGSEPY